MMSYIEQLESRARTKMVIELYPEMDFDEVESLIGSEFIVKKKTSVKGAFYVRLKDGYEKEIISERELDRANYILRLVDFEMDKIKKENPDAPVWYFSTGGFRANDIYKTISYLESTTDYAVNKTSGIGAIRFALKNKRGPYNKYGFNTMGVGDYYTLDDTDKISSVRAYACSAAKKLGIKLKVSAKERRIYRVK